MKSVYKVFMQKQFEVEIENHMSILVLSSSCIRPSSGWTLVKAEWDLLEVLEKEVPERMFGFLKCVLGDCSKTFTRGVHHFPWYLTMPIGDVTHVMYQSVVDSL